MEDEAWRLSSKGFLNNSNNMDTWGRKVCLNCRNTFIPIPEENVRCDDCYYFGVEAKEFQKIISTGNRKGNCAVCGMFKEKLYIDHCHKSGYFRGLICRECNLGLGLFKDSIRCLENAAKYLSKFNKSPEDDEESK